VVVDDMICHQLAQGRRGAYPQGLHEVVHLPRVVSQPAEVVVAVVEAVRR
jgi:hypothetical protein